MAPPKRPNITALFNAAVGKHGAGTADSLAAEQPTQRARDEADRICSAVAAGDVAEAVRQLNRESRDVAAAPLLQQLADALADALHPQMLAHQSIVDALDALHLNPHEEGRIVVYFDNPLTMHLWPDESQFVSATKPAGLWLNAVVSVRTACHKHLDPADCGHAHRGGWLGAQNGVVRCRPCTAVAQLFSETADIYELGLAREIQAALAPDARCELLAIILQQASLGTLDPQTVIDTHAMAVYQGHVRAAAVDVLRYDGESSLMRILFEYQSLRGSSSQDLAAKLSRADWHDVVDSAFSACDEGHNPVDVGRAAEQQLTDLLKP